MSRPNMRLDARRVCCPMCRWKGARIYRPYDGGFGTCPKCFTTVKLAPPRTRHFAEKG